MATAPDHKRLRRFDDPGRVHHLNCSTYRGLPLLVDESNCNSVARSLRAACSKHEVDLLGFVFMPEHVHLVVHPRPVVYHIADFCRDFKRASSREIADGMRQFGDIPADLVARERPGVTRFRFWQEGGGHDRNIALASEVPGVLQYVHANPVRRELCQVSTDYRWSSARIYEGPSIPDDPAIALVTRFEGI